MTQFCVTQFCAACREATKHTVDGLCEECRPKRFECATCRRGLGWVEAAPHEDGAVFCRGKAADVWRKPCPTCNPWPAAC